MAFFVDDMPINLRTHRHGQGYTDLSFIIPETIEGIDVVKGTNHEEFGDFDTAGAVRFKTREVLKENVVQGYRQSGDLFGIRAVATAGFQVRDDTISNISLGTQTKRVSTGTIVESAVQEASYSPYMKLELQPTPWMRLSGGVRADYFTFDVRNLCDTFPQQPSGRTDSGQVSPKANLILGPWSNTEFS